MVIIFQHIDIKTILEWFEFLPMMATGDGVLGHGPYGSPVVRCAHGCGIAREMGMKLMHRLSLLYRQPSGATQAFYRHYGVFCGRLWAKVVFLIISPVSEKEY